MSVWCVGSIAQVTESDRPLPVTYCRWLSRGTDLCSVSFYLLGASYYSTVSTWVCLKRSAWQYLKPPFWRMDAWRNSVDLKILRRQVHKDVNVRQGCLYISVQTAHSVIFLHIWPSATPWRLWVWPWSPFAQYISWSPQRLLSSFRQEVKPR